MLSKIPDELLLTLNDVFEDDEVTTTCLSLTCKRYYSIFAPKTRISLESQIERQICSREVESGKIDIISEVHSLHHLLSSWMPPTHKYNCPERKFRPAEKCILFPTDDWQRLVHQTSDSSPNMMYFLEPFKFDDISKAKEKLRRNFSSKRKTMLFMNDSNGRLMVKMVENPETLPIEEMARLVVVKERIPLLAAGKPVGGVRNEEGDRTFDTTLERYTPRKA